MSKHELVIDSGIGAAFLGAHGIAVNLNYTAAASVGRSAPVTPFMEPKHGTVGGNRMAAWGSNNLLPQDRIKLIAKDTELPQLLDFAARMLRGQGIMPFRIDGYDDNGNEKLVPAKDEKEVLAFCRGRKTQQWLSESSVDMRYFYNVFPQMIVSRDRSMITNIVHQESAFCRLSEMDGNGKIPACYINANWENYNEAYTIVQPVIDTRAVDDVERLRADNKYSYIYRVKYPVPGNPFYATPLHEGFFTGGWYDVSQAIPEAKKYMMKQLWLVRYHLEIADWWWEKRYPGWGSEDFDPEKRMEIQADELKKFNDFLTGAKNAGKTIQTAMEWDDDANAYKSAWKITAIPDVDKDGKWIDDSREASMHKLRAMGLDPAIIGAGPGRDNASAGSGSDKWAAIKLYLAGLTMHREVLLQPIQFIFDYNGWTEKGLVPRIVDHSFFYTNTASEKKTTEKNETPNPPRKDA